MQWLIYKNSVQYLVMMELQLAERQRERRLLSTLRAWSSAAAAVRSEREAMAAAAAQRSPEVPPAGDESFDASFRSFDSDGMPAFPLLRSARDVSSIQLYSAERDHTLILSGTLRKTTADALLDPTLCYPMV